MPATATGKLSHSVLGPEGLTSRRLRKASFRRRFPERALHVVDIENLAGAAIPSLALVSEVQVRYLGCLRFGADDQVVLAASHLALLNAGLGDELRRGNVAVPRVFSKPAGKLEGFLKCEGKIITYGSHAHGEDYTRIHAGYPWRPCGRRMSQRSACLR